MTNIIDFDESKFVPVTGEEIRQAMAHDDPIRCNYTDPSSGDQCLLWGGHGGDHNYGMERPRGILAAPEGESWMPDFKSGNEPETAAPPKPVKRLAITNTDPLRGIIEMECTPELRMRIDAAGLGTVVRGMALSCTLHLPLKLYNFDQVVAWLESLA